MSLKLFPSISVTNHFQFSFAVLLYKVGRCIQISGFIWWGKEGQNKKERNWRRNGEVSCKVHNNNALKYLSANIQDLYLLSALRSNASQKNLIRFQWMLRTVSIFIRFESPLVYLYKIYIERQCIKFLRLTDLNRRVVLL